jgi:acyl-CoA synthetase (AMP-forming)/AMP-acid ligase II
MSTKTPMLMGDGLRRNAWKFPVKIAAKDRFREITYADLNARVNQLAHGLLSLGVRKGDAVALSVGNRIEHLEIVFATAKIGALAIPVDVKWKALELAPSPPRSSRNSWFFRRIAFKSSIKRNSLRI